MAKTTILGFLLVLFLPWPVVAQRPEAVEHGIMRLECPSKAAGTAFVVEQLPGDKKLLATAAHVVTLTINGVDQPGQMWSGPAYTLQLGEAKWKGTVVSYDAPNDVAILVSDIPLTFKVLPIKDVEGLDEPTPMYLPSRKEAQFFGYPGGEFTETRGFVAFVDKNRVFSDATLIPGQSGGPMVVDKAIAGVISGGSEWFTASGAKTVTWPARCCTAKRLREMVEFAKGRVK